MYILEIGFWCLKWGFRHILSSTTWKCAWKVCFIQTLYLGCVWSEFNLTNREPCPKVGVLAYKVSRLSEFRGFLPNAYLFYDRITGRFIVAKQTAEFSILRHMRGWEKTIPMCLKSRLKHLFKPCLFVCVITSRVFYLLLTEITRTGLLLFS